MSRIRKVIVVGLDGLEPKLVEPLLAAGQLPHLARLRETGGYARVATTYPAQTPVAWSTFATGTNPGGHGIFDFVRRHAKMYLPDLGLNYYEQKNPFLPPRPVNRRRGTTVWQLLSQAGRSSAIVRCPCTYPPDEIRGRMLSGMGVPDLRGGLGTATFYTSRVSQDALERENLVHVTPEGNQFRTHLVGPRNPKGKTDFRVEMTCELRAAEGKLLVRPDGGSEPLEVHLGQWSDWLHVRFKLGFLQSVRAMVRFYLKSLEPELELYGSPLNFDPQAPYFPFASPEGYAKELADKLGDYYTTGMVEDDGGLKNGRLTEEAFLAQCDDVWSERRRMMHYELERFDDGLFYVLYDTPDRIQHMFWRFREPDHPANVHGFDPRMASVIDDAYRTCDAIVGEALEYADDETLVIAMSDHGFNSFRRGVHLNAWLHQQGLLALKGGVEPGEAAGELLRQVDWTKTKAYALGLSGIYLNIAGREGKGIVPADEANNLAAEIATALSGLIDPKHNQVAIRSVLPRGQVYAGPYVDDAPDLIVNYAAGYRVSWGTALGCVAAERLEDNTKKWSGDHIIDPELVPGVLFMNRPFRTSGARMIDLAPTILAALGVENSPEMEGVPLAS